VITGKCPEWDESEADRLYHSIIGLSGLRILRPPGQLSRELDITELLKIFDEWVARDHDAHDDPAYHAKFDAKSANCRISGRLTATQNVAKTTKSLRKVMKTWIDEMISG
jgi:hypothetical protein